MSMNSIKSIAIVAMAAPLCWSACHRAAEGEARAADGGAQPAPANHSVTADPNTPDQVPLTSAFGPVVAGHFYPGDAAELNRDLDRYLAAAPLHQVPEPLLGLMVPHAGYAYSGWAAAHAYRVLQGRPIGLVIILSPSHRAAAPHAGTLLAHHYSTPLGPMPIEVTAVRQLLRDAPEIVRIDPRLFEREHALEVQLPFVQRVLPGVPMVPLVLGHARPELTRKLAQALHGLLGTRTDAVVLASSDMSHYLAPTECERVDAESLRLIRTMDPALFHQALSEDRAQLCGGGGVATLMELLRVRTGGGGEARVLFHNHSGDTSPQRDRVVGYGVVAFGGGPPRSPTTGAIVASAAGSGAATSYQLSPVERQLLLKLARDTVELWVKERRLPEFHPPAGVLSQPGAAFVTLRKQGELRGCIGRTEPTGPLWECVRQVATEAATQDPRFAPVDPAELSQLTVEVSVLTPLQPLPDPRQVQVGTDGLLVTWLGRRGLLLPQVPGEFGWGREEFLTHTCQKARLPPDCWQTGASFQKFQALVFGEATAR